MHTCLRTRLLVVWTDLVGMAGDERTAGVVDGLELPITTVTNIRTAWHIIQTYMSIRLLMCCDLRMS